MVISVNNAKVSKVYKNKSRAAAKRRRNRRNRKTRRLKALKEKIETLAAQVDLIYPPVLYLPIVHEQEESPSPCEFHINSPRPNLPDSVSSQLTYRIFPDSPVSLSLFPPPRSPTLEVHYVEKVHNPLDLPILGSHNLEDEDSSSSPVPSVEFLKELPPLFPRYYFAPGPL